MPTLTIYLTRLSKDQKASSKAAPNNKSAESIDLKFSFPQGNFTTNTYVQIRHSEDAMTSYLSDLDITLRKTLTSGRLRDLEFILSPEELEKFLTPLIIGQRMICDSEILTNLPPKSDVRSAYLKNISQKEEEIDSLLVIYKSFAEKFNIPTDSINFPPEKTDEKTQTLDLKLIEKRLIEKSAALYHLYRNLTQTINTKVTSQKKRAELVQIITRNLKGFFGKEMAAPIISQKQILPSQWAMVGLHPPTSNEVVTSDLLIVPMEKSVPKNGQEKRHLLFGPEDELTSFKVKEHRVHYQEAMHIIPIVIDNIGLDRSAHKSWFSNSFGNSDNLLTGASSDRKAITSKEQTDTHSDEKAVVAKKTFSFTQSVINLFSSSNAVANRQKAKEMAAFLQGDIDLIKVEDTAAQFQRQKNPVHALLSWKGEFPGLGFKRNEYTNDEFLKILGILLGTKADVEKCLFDEVEFTHYANHTVTTRAPVISILTLAPGKQRLSEERYFFDDEQVKSYESQTLGNTRYQAAKMIYEAIEHHKIKDWGERYNKSHPLPIPLDQLKSQRQEEQQREEERERKKQEDAIKKQWVEEIAAEYNAAYYAVEAAEDNNKAIPEDDQLFMTRRDSKNPECYQAGCRYLNGTADIKKDLHRAMLLLKEAAIKKDPYPPAEVTLGNCYEQGLGVQKNEKEAVRLYQKAADQKNPDAQRELGRCYEHGIGVDKADNAKALHYYSLASHQGDKEATKLHEALTKKPVAESKSKQGAAAERNAQQTSSSSVTTAPHSAMYGSSNPGKGKASKPTPTVGLEGSLNSDSSQGKK